MFYPTFDQVMEDSAHWTPEEMAYVEHLIDQRHSAEQNNEFITHNEAIHMALDLFLTDKWTIEQFSNFNWLMSSIDETKAHGMRHAEYENSLEFSLARNLLEHLGYTLTFSGSTTMISW